LNLAITDKEFTDNIVLYSADPESELPILKVKAAEPDAILYNATQHRET